MVSRSFFAKLSILSLSVFFLCQCTKVNDNTMAARVSSKSASPFTLPAAAYLAMAENQIGSERESMLIMAAGRYLTDGAWKNAQETLVRTDNLSPIQANEKTILQAKIDLMRSQPKSAIAKLSSVHRLKQLSPYYQQQYHDTLARSYETAGNPSYAVTERIKLDRLLPEGAERANNQRILWLTLAKMPAADLNTLSMEAKDGSELQGWMKLALIPRQAGGDKQILLSEVEQWQRVYSAHPANGLLPSPLSAVKPFLNQAPDNIALLVPLTGPLAGPGNAVRDGFLAAYNNSRASGNVHVRLYDTASGDIRSLYNQALSEGANYIVGPLTKSDVSVVAGLSHPVPTLLLNDLDGEKNVSDNAYRFGLSPNNEARQVAAKAGKNGLRKALIIAPAGAWGDEIVNAFTDQWQQAGGQVTDKMVYDNQSDLNLAVRQFLRVSERDAAEKQYKAGSAEALNAGPKRRQDFDMIFLLAYPSKARQIMPLLKYYFAGDVPVYATSAVYAGSTDTLRDRDLDGIIFCDMPWVFGNQLANRNWPEQLNSYNRLYALGMDSYSLATQLNQLMLFPAMGINDKSGVLYLNRARQVARILAWGRFKNGVATQTGETLS
ncbi:penicillin-binding protein activator [Legionella dresdenensis]|uniref:Penicillin-binding protein activator n=1 Tax=Legionella dresdenensis TaxID=450200 RepID=A0ABV8CD24_9GAMM